MSRYIDADKLKEHYMWWGGGFTANCKDGQKEVKKIFDEIIDLQPTADVRENVRGEWIDDGIHGDWAWEQDGHGNFWHFWKCSRCGMGTKTRSNYCPNCGADMRGDTT